VIEAKCGIHSSTALQSVQVQVPLSMLSSMGELNPNELTTAASVVGASSLLLWYLTNLALDKYHSFGPLTVSTFAKVASPVALMKTFSVSLSPVSLTHGVTVVSLTHGGDGISVDDLANPWRASTNAFTSGCPMPISIISLVPKQ